MTLRQTTGALLPDEVLSYSLRVINGKLGALESAITALKGEGVEHAAGTAEAGMVDQLTGATGL